jgi:hypothetical protein
MKRFIVLARNTTAQQNSEFVKYLESNNMTWWSWIPNAWLIVDIFGTHTQTAIRDKLLTLFPDVRTLVIDVTEAGPQKWAGFGPTNLPDPKLDMFKWINESWDLR